jgi:hypothetical protein
MFVFIHKKKINLIFDLYYNCLLMEEKLNELLRRIEKLESDACDERAKQEQRESSACSAHQLANNAFTGLSGAPSLSTFQFDMMNRPAQLTSIDSATSVAVSSSSSSSSSSSELLPFEQVPIVQRAPKVRAQFLKEQWLPYLRELRDALLQSQTKMLHEFSANERLPPQAEMDRWARRCVELTLLYYGKPNLSAFYEFYIEVSAVSGDKPYRMTQIPMHRSDDGYALVVDARVRKSFYKSKPPAAAAAAVAASVSVETSSSNEVDLATKQQTLDESVRSMLTPTGALEHRVGESGIDNTLLPNLLTKREARVLIVGGIVKTFLLRLLAFRMRRALARVDAAVPWFRCARQTPAQIRRALSKLASSAGGAERLTELGVRADDLSFRLLVKLGQPVGSWGQLPADEQRAIHEWLRSSIDERCTGGESPQERELADFLSFTRAHPGSVYKRDKRLHKKMLFLGVWCDKLALIPRSTIENLTEHRFFAIKWQRAVPLYTLDEYGDEAVRVVRDVGAQEYSRFRQNNYPYLFAHGLSVSTSGVREDRSSPLFDVGSSLPVDGTAKLRNHYITDIEKILREAEMLSPPSAFGDHLPGEELHAVGQNPRSSSSIGATQHTHICRTSTGESPIFELENKPCFFARLCASVDIVQVGSYIDSFFVKLRTKRPTAPAILKLLVKLRLHLMQTMGRSNVDFNVACVPSGDGWFTISFAPIALEIGSACGVKATSFDQHSSSSPANAAAPSSDVGAAVNLPVRELGFPSGLGVLLVNSDEGTQVALADGRRTMARLYDYCRAPGSRAITRQWLLGKLGYVDRMRQITRPARVEVRAFGHDTTFKILETLRSPLKGIKRVEQVERLDRVPFPLHSGD